MLKIKLFPKGKKHQRSYRVVISEARSKFDGKFTDDIGYYTPKTNTFKIDQTLFDSWIKKGAQPTTGVALLLKKFSTSHGST